MKLLIISPDYLSHALPLVQIGSSWKRSQGEVFLATGEATRPVVEAAGLTWIELRLGAGSNGGVIEVDEQPAGEDDHLQRFFDATRSGPIETLAYQADARRHDLLHEPDRVYERLAEIIDTVQPDRVLVDHVAFGARLALHALGIDAATAVLGHPSALVAPGELYGVPADWPAEMKPNADDLAVLVDICEASIGHLHEACNEFLGRRSPERPDIDDLTSTPGHPTIYVYPEALHDQDRPLPEHHLSIGALARTESLGDFELPSGTGPRVTVALGSFLSARGDVLATAVAAAQAGGWRLALAHGSTPLDHLGEPPVGAVIARHLPQVALLASTDVIVHHGGNGSTTEAAAAGVPMVVLPFSTDQFAAAAAIERAGLGVALAPNTLTVDALVAAVEGILASDAPARARDVADSIERDGGPQAAVTAIVKQGRHATPNLGASVKHQRSSRTDI